MRSQRRVTPGAVGLVISIGPTRPTPNSGSSTAATAPALMQCAHGYSGCIGVSTNGTQLGSGAVASLPSLSPLRIAVTGRQKLKAYLASNTATKASVAAMLTSAKSLAFSSRLLGCAAASERSIGFHVTTPTAVQNRATSVCSGVRCALVFAPIALISL